MVRNFCISIQIEFKKSKLSFINFLCAILREKYNPLHDNKKVFKPHCKSLKKSHLNVTSYLSVLAFFKSVFHEIDF